MGEEFEVSNCEFQVGGSVRWHGVSYKKAAIYDRPVEGRALDEQAGSPGIAMPGLGLRGDGRTVYDAGLHAREL